MNPIISLRDEFNGIIAVLGDDTSRVNSLKEVAKKTVILATASFLESRLTDLVLSELRIRNVDACPAFNFGKSMGVVRQYHAWFDWKTKNINKFLIQFGDGFKEEGRKYIDNHADRKNLERDFMTVGSTRNLLIHNNFLSYTIDLTYEDSLAISLNACGFADMIVEMFSNFHLVHNYYSNRAPEDVTA